MKKGKRSKKLKVNSKAERMFFKGVNLPNLFFVLISFCTTQFTIVIKVPRSENEPTQRFIDKLFITLFLYHRVDQLANYHTAITTTRTLRAKQQHRHLQICRRRRQEGPSMHPYHPHRRRLSCHRIGKHRVS